jgi:hypothetical protein
MDLASASINESVAQRNIVERQIAQRKQLEEEKRIREEVKRLYKERQKVDKHKTTEDRRLEKILEQTQAKKERERRRKLDISAQIALGTPITAKMADEEFDAQLYGKGDSVNPSQIYDGPLFNGENKPYVPFSDGQRISGSDASSGHPRELRFERGERETPDERSGAFCPKGRPS